VPVQYQIGWENYQNYYNEHRWYRKYSKNLNRKIFFDYELKKTNWFNIGGKAKIYFKPETLQELIEFLKLYNNRGKIFVIGAGSNIYFKMAYLMEL